MPKKLKSTARTSVCLRQGREQEIRFGRLPECAALVPVVRESTDALKTAWEGTAQSAETLIGLRVSCDFADRDWDKAVRAAASSAESTCGGKKSPAWRELFPDGISGLVTQTGEPQKLAADRFLLHLSTCTTPGAKLFLEEWGPKLTKARDGLAAALEARAAGEKAFFLARAQERAAKRDFLRTMDKLIGEVRVIYPEDRATQDLAFPSFDLSAGADTDEAEPVPEADLALEPA